MPDHPPTRNLSVRARWLLLLATITAVVLVDQWTKHYAVVNWKDQPRQTFFGDLFRIEYAENTGAFLGLFGNFSPTVRFWILTVINSAILLGVAIYLMRSRQIEWSTFFPLAMVVAGGIGNLIDRIRFDYVIDFFNLGLGHLRTGIFNVADMAISAGFLMMLPIVFHHNPSSAESSDRSPVPQNHGLPEQTSST